MKYLITLKGLDPFLSKWYEYENHYVKGMVIYDLSNMTYSVNGIDFNEIDIDHL